jgi:hypothetical protein
MRLACPASGYQVTPWSNPTCVRAWKEVELSEEFLIEQKRACKAKAQQEYGAAPSAAETVRSALPPDLPIRMLVPALGLASLVNVIRSMTGGPQAYGSEPCGPAAGVCGVSQEEPTPVQTAVSRVILGPQRPSKLKKPAAKPPTYLIVYNSTNAIKIHQMPFYTID